ncbi:MAG: YicC family protein [Bacteroidetes bacterium]|nr:YicC family protein [Bacteroidota bacterium]MBU1719268.1 YicC family protein [Bacteroidota bacterium]
MIYSMTGFGKSSAENTQRKFSVEIKSVNGKQSDVKLRLPSFLNEMEPMIRSQVVSALTRGSIDVHISIENISAGPSLTLNLDVAANFHQKLQELTKTTGIPASPDPMAIIMRLPEVTKIEKSEITDEDIHSINNALKKAIDSLLSFRKTEGRKLLQDIEKQTQIIEENLQKVRQLEPLRTNHIRQRLTQLVANASEQVSIDNGRLEQEVLFYMERNDITEEMVRLDSHCKYFRETLNIQESQGKKLGFISQEIGREINTIGSKANDMEIQRVVVEMKDALEKIKEQLMNVL